MTRGNYLNYQLWVLYPAVSRQDSKLHKEKNNKMRRISTKQMARVAVLSKYKQRTIK